MNLDNVMVADIETKGLLHEISEPSDFHVLSVGYKDSKNKWSIKSTNKEEDVRKVFENPNNVIVGHYFIPYDAPALEKMFGFKIKATIIDSIGISWYLYNKRKKHGLEEWGEEIGIEKLKVDPSEWKTISYEKATARCESDVKINVTIWLKFLKYLREIYDNDEDIFRVIKYLNHKLECLRDQEKLKVNISEDKVQEAFDFFLPQKDEKFEVLKSTMPKIENFTVRKRPSKLTKRDGSLSVAGIKWLTLLKSQGLPEDYEGEVKELTSTSEPNPNSPDQIKNWLYSLLWKPITFEARKNTKGEINQIPQINLKDGNLCESVRRLIKKEPAVEELEGLGVIKHRLGLLKAFRECNENGKVVAGAHALTSTMRLKHVRPIANLPKYTGKKDIKDGYWIRGCIVAPDGYEICGSDMSSLEDRVKQHFIYDYDREYVETMMAPDFDPHLDLAVVAGALTQEQADNHKKGVEDHKDVRHTYKTGNYTCQFGAGGPRIAKTLDIPVKEGKEIHGIYWKRNWSVKSVSKDAFYKTVDGKMWLLNPISNFYYPLRNTKDIFSSLCQAGGVYIFDMWIYFMRLKGFLPVLQYHDEVLLYIDEIHRKEVKQVLQESVEKVNNLLKLKRDMGIDVQFGSTYAEVH